MTRYRIVEHASAVSVELTEVGGLQDELLSAFAECQDGRCSCPTDEYQKVATMEIVSGPDRIAIELEAKPGTRFESAELAGCLDHTIAKADREDERPRARPTTGIV